jgi:hypothetical protein
MLQLVHKCLAISLIENEVVARHCRDAINKFGITCLAKAPKKFHETLFDWFVEYHACSTLKKPIGSLNASFGNRHGTVQTTFIHSTR